MTLARYKIAILPTWYPHPEHPFNGVFVHDQAQCLAARHDVTVLFPNYANQPAAEFLEEHVDGVRTFRLAPTRQSLWSKLLDRVRRPDSSALYYRKYCDAVGRGFEHYVRVHGKPDVIHAHVVLPAGWLAWKLGTKHQIPVVLTEHSGPFTFHLATAWQRTLARETLRGVDRLFAVSPSLANIMSACFPDVEPRVLGNVIRTDYLTPAPVRANAAFRFFSLATLVEAKGIHHLLEATSILRTHGVNEFEVAIGGAGPQRAKLEELADRWNLRARCHFLGSLDRLQVREQMRQCDAFVLPSLGETFSLAVGEAMACGKPVIATRCGGPEFVVTADTGVLVSTARPMEMADAMAGFLKGGYRFDAGVIRNSVVARFGVDTFVGNLEVVYGELISKSTPLRMAA